MMQSLKDLVQHNLPVKIFALIVAVVLWLFVMNEHNPVMEGSYNVPLEVINQPDGYQINVEETKVKVLVKGQRSLFVNTAERDVHAYIDLAEMEEGEQSIKVQVELPQGFEILEIHQARVKVVADKLIERTFPIDLKATGTPDKGMALAKMEKEHSIVKVSGPRSLVDQVVRVVGYVPLTGSQEEFKQQVVLSPIGTDDHEVNGVKLERDSMEVTVHMAHGLLKKIVSITPNVMEQELPEGLTLVHVKASPEKIEITGDRKEIDRISTLRTEHINLSNIRQNTTMKAKLELPTGITAANTDITVTLEVKEKQGEKEK